MNTTFFESGMIAPLIVGPLRYFFSNYTDSSNLIWHEDEKIRTIDIGESYDFNKVPLQEKPRILVTRGQFNITKPGISDNLAEARLIRDTFGKKDNTYFVFYSGNATITVEARNKGTCEVLLTLASKFLIWSRPIICDSQGFKEFGLPMGISEISMCLTEDKRLPVFQANIGVPWIREESWLFRNDGITLKDIALNID